MKKLLHSHFICLAALTILFGGSHFVVRAQLISTYAGTGIRGYNGTGGAARATQLNYPFSVAFDASNNLYIADWTNNIIRKVTPSRVITNFAGTDTPGCRGDGGPATNALFSYPVFISIDSLGNFLIGDEYNHRIRKINTSGVITTIAGNGTGAYGGDGGPATAAMLNHPLGAVADGAGNIYISERDDPRIRKIDGLGIITTIAGCDTNGYSGDGGPATAAKFDHVGGIALDASGNILIADLGNNRIRKITPAGIISTIAGNGVTGYGGDGGPASLAQFHTPNAVSVDAGGNIYVGDAGNSAIRKINTSGIITTIAGTGVAGYSGDGGPATAAQLRFCSQVAADASGNIFIADQQNHRIRCIGCEILPESLAMDADHLSEISLVPNPSNGTFTINLASPSNESARVTLTNILGQKVKELTMLSNEDLLVQLEATPGVYYVSIVLHGEVITRSVVIE